MNQEIKSRNNSNLSPTDALMMRVRLNQILLRKKQHIKEYYKVRKFHSDIIDHMIQYVEDGNYDLETKLEVVTESILKEINGDRSKIKFDIYDEDDMNIFYELLCYKNHPKLTSITEEYIAKKKFRAPDKIKMLEAMNQSYVSLFKIIDVDSDNGYITLEDVFTKKTFKVIDVALSSSSNTKNKFYIYNRIITYNNITFGTGIHIMFKITNKEVNNYIKNHKKKSQTSMARCLDFYNITKNHKDVAITPNHNYR